MRAIAVVLAFAVPLLISCGGSPPEEDVAQVGAATADGAAAGQNDESPVSAVPMRWIAMEQVSPIVGDDGTLSETLGLELPGGAFQKVIARGERAPVTRHFTLATAVPNQRELTIHVLRGEADRAEENTSLGWYRIEEIPSGPEKGTLIALVLRVADDAVVGAAVMPNERIPLRMVPSAPPPKR